MELINFEAKLKSGVTVKVKTLEKGKKEKCSFCNGSGKTFSDEPEDIEVNVCEICKGTGKLNKEIAIFELAKDNLNMVCECGHDWNMHNVLDNKACHSMDCACDSFKQPSAKKGDVEELICPACEGIKTINFRIEKGVLLCHLCKGNDLKVELTEDEFQVEIIKVKNYANKEGYIMELKGKSYWQTHYKIKELAFLFAVVSSSKMFEILHREFGLDEPKKFNVKIVRRID